MIPDDLLERFEPLARISVNPRRGSEAWQVEPRTGGALRILKLVPAHRAASDQLLTELRDYARAHPDWPVEPPEESGWCRDGRHYTLQRYHHAGSLADPDNLGEGLDHLRPVFADLAAQLDALHGLPDGPVVHGDIKPANVLVQRTPGGVRYRLGDFDAARRFDPITRRGAHPSQCTPSYAAPEVLSEGEVMPAIDYWSLGMTLLVLHLGRHPLDGLDENRQRGFIGGDWRPDELRQIDDVRWRALLSGLLDRNADNRWGAEQCRRWLEDDDSVLASGLALLHENAALVPYRLGSRSVLTARTLAEALLAEWSPDALHDPALLTWLRDDLRREDLAAFSERLRMDETLSPELRLLHFCCETHREIPPLWRGRELSLDNVIAAAEAARAGDAAHHDWLHSLIDGDAVQFFASRGHAGCIALRRNLVDGWRDYENAWRELIAAGAPADARPPDNEALPQFARIAASPDARQAFVESVAALFAPQHIFLRAPWFLRFGSDPDAISIGRGYALSQLNHASRLDARHLTSLDELATLDLDAPSAPTSHVLSAQGDLLEDFAVPAGAVVSVLAPGVVHRLYPTSSIARELGLRLHDLGAALRTRLERLRIRIVPKLGGLPPDPSQLHLDVQLLPLTAKNRYFEGRARTSAQLARITWRFPEGLRVKLRLSHAGALLAPPALSTPPLRQPEGSLIVVLTDDTRIQLFGKRCWYGTAVRTAPLDILFPPTPALRPVCSKLARIHGAIRRACDRFVRSDHAVQPTTAKLTPANGNVQAATDTMLRPQSKRFQTALYRALTRHHLI
jgi:hypothetical protein